MVSLVNNANSLVPEAVLATLVIRIQECAIADQVGREKNVTNVRMIWLGKIVTVHQAAVVMNVTRAQRGVIVVVLVCGVQNALSLVQ